MADRHRTFWCEMDKSAVWAKPLHRCMLVLTGVLLLCEVVTGRLCNSLMNMVDSFHTLYVLLGMTISTRVTEENPSVSTEPQDEPCTDSSVVAENRTSPPSDGSQYRRSRVQPVVGAIAALLLSSLFVSISFDILSHIVQPHPIQRPVLVTAVGAVSLLFNLLLLVWRRLRPDTGTKELRKAETGSPLPPADSPRDGVLMFCNPGASSVLNAYPREHTLHPQTSPVSHDSTHSETAGQELKCRSSSGLAAAQQCGASVGSVLTVSRSLLGPALVLLSGFVHLVCVRFHWSCDVIVYLDPGLSTIAVLVLLAAVFPELRRHVLLLLQASPSGLCTEVLRAELRRVPGVLAVHELHVWQLSETCIVASVHVHWPLGLSACECSQLLHSIAEVLRRFGAMHWTIQPEFLTSDPEDAALQPDYCTLHCGKACVGKMCCLPPQEPFSSASVHVHDRKQDVIIQNTHLQH